MEYIAHIRAEAELIDDASMRQVCLRIVDEVEQRISRNRGGKWTFHTFSKWMKGDVSDDLLQQCIFLLAHKREYHLLEMHFLFFDPTDPDDIGQPIDDADVAHAYRSGELIDPRTGQPIFEFETALVPYFVANPALEDPIHGRGIGE